MSMSKLKIWITDLGNPCRMSQRDWVVAITDCNGKVVTWCKKKYDNIPAPCGHVEVELPPGTYIIRASAHTWWYQGKLYGNWTTDRGVVTVCCNEDACITLYAPTIQACWIPLFSMVFPTLVQNKVLPPEVAKAAETINNAIVKLESTEFEKGEADMLRTMFAGLARRK